MSMSDPLSDMLTRIRNGQRASKQTVSCSASKFRANVLDVLEREGFIRGFSWAELRTGIQELTIELVMYSSSATTVSPLTNSLSVPKRPFQFGQGCSFTPSTE